MLASAAALTLPPLIEPPIRITSFTSGTIEGSFSTASAMLVSGPTGTSVIWCGDACTSSMMRSGPKRASTVHLLRAGGHRDVAAARQRYHAQRVVEPHRRGDVARHDGDGADVKLGRVQRQH